MGTDIHVCVERRVNGVWNAVLKTRGYSKEDSLYWLDIDRNYSLFAILADVRNGFGFAGCDTGDGFVPISKPRGLPPDVSAKILRDYDEGWGHSISWLTLQEILDYDWTQITKRRGWVNGIEYFNWIQYNRRLGESPDSWSGGMYGPDIKHITVAEMDEEIKKIEQQNSHYHDQIKAIEETLKNVYCKVEWEQPYYKCCRRFWSDVIPQLLRLGKPEDVRLVFWFDN